MAEPNLDFINEYREKVKELDLNWDIRGVVDQEDNVYSLTNDAKIVGRIFELLAAPAIREVATDHGMGITPAESQTIYPDFTIEKEFEYEDEEDGLRKGDKILEIEGDQIETRNDVSSIAANVNEDEELSCTVSRSGNEKSISVKAGEFLKIAVDVKTTYRTFYSRKYTYPNGDTYEAGDPQPYTFTLGSYASFLRNHTKNIQYDYRSYKDHFIIGFIYTRNPDSVEGIVKKYEDREDILSPYQDVEYFVQRKYKIAGVKPGSGNTENIGSFRTNDIEELRQGNGPFSDHGKSIYKEYWRNHQRYRSNNEYFTDIDEFFEWKSGD